MNKTRRAWADSQVERIVESEDVSGGLEELASTYWPDNIIPVIDDEPQRNIKDYLYDEFVRSYQYHRETGHSREKSIYKATKSMVYHVVNTRMEAYGEEEEELV